MRRIRKKSKKFLAIFLLLVITLVGFTSYKYFFKGEKFENPIKEIKEIIEKEPENPIKTFKAKLLATGDGLIHPGLYNAAKKNGTYDFTPMLTYTKEKLVDYDIKYYNQETVFDDSKRYDGYPIFNTPSAFGEAMIDAGFNVVSLATNHSMDAGASSAKKSATWWESHDEILTHGMASSEEARNNYQIMDANGITYTLLSYTYGTNGLGRDAINKEPFLVNLFDEEMVKKDIAAVRDKVDILIVAMHWGNEYQLVASETQKKQAKFLAENGVDIVLGNHSHCLQPWEWIDNTVVFYSFGNFISNQMGADEALIKKVGSIGAFGTLEITKTVDTRDNTTEIKIDNIGAELNYTYRFYDQSIGKNNYIVIPFSKMEDKYLNNYFKGKKVKNVYDEFSAILKKYDDSIVIEPLNPNLEN